MREMQFLSQLELERTTTTTTTTSYRYVILDGWVKKWERFAPDRCHYFSYLLLRIKKEPLFLVHVCTSMNVLSCKYMYVISIRMYIRTCMHTMYERRCPSFTFFSNGSLTHSEIHRSILHPVLHVICKKKSKIETCSITF